MSDRQRIINIFREKLESKDYIYALWEEGSFPQGFGDEYSDLDFWISTDDDKVFAIFDEIEQILSELGEIDFKYINKPRGELGSNTYHVKGMSEYLQIDMNTQGISRGVYLVRGIDEANVIFDKRGVVKFQDREEYAGDIEVKRQKLHDFYELMRPRLAKSIKRDTPLETLYYWHLILQYATKFLRRKYGWHDKAEYDLKHIHRDLPKEIVDTMRGFYDTRISEIENKIPDLKEWIWSL